MNPILHHYDFSNFSEKVRLMFGFKGIEWDSVEIPSHLPKPDYTPLTGGYRRTPALQIGADVYCDTRLIGELLESRYPQPSFFPGGARERSLTLAIARWAEWSLLWPTALYITGINAERFDADFHHDRARLHQKSALPDVAKVKASASKYLAQMRAGLADTEDLFANGSSFVLGNEMTLADLTLYHVPWFLNKIEPAHEFFETHPRLVEWMERVAAVGHGTPHRVEAQRAIDLANAEAPLAIECGPENPEGIELGADVKVSALDEYSPAIGQLAGADDQQIVIDVSNDRVQHVRVHFPRGGYRLSRSR